MINEKNMCGIAGIVDAGEPEQRPRVIEAMAASLRHRGLTKKVTCAEVKSGFTRAVSALWDWRTDGGR
jgi:asparagine synthetase B (glutamine-hydrolysing)